MPVVFREKERKCREEWLSETFSKRLNTIRELVKHLYTAKENIPQLKYFTPHGTTHCEAVENLMFRLIPNDHHKELSEDEKFFLLGSAWLHDIGMIRGIMGDDEEGITDDKIREDHHIRSEQFIIKNYREVGVDEPEKEAFGLLSRFHRRRCPLSDCAELLPVPNHHSIRLRLLAAYLRLADALHIDQTRAPDAQYAISLAYDIPNKSKLHWLRSKFVMGLNINVEGKEIGVHLKKPIIKESEEGESHHAMERTLDSIYDLIVQDLSAELETVKDTLYSANISYFLRISKRVHKVEFDRQLLRDIRGVFNYYHLLDNPSSSALYKLLLQSISEILKSYKLSDSENNPEIKASALKAVNSFLIEIDERVLNSRKCHIGLRNFIDEIREVLKDDDLIRLNELIVFKGWLLELKRTGVRFSAYRYFNQNLVDKPVYNILLYGYSELVIKSITGFRDAVLTKLIEKHYDKDKIAEFKKRTADVYPWQSTVGTPDDEIEIKSIFEKEKEKEKDENESSSKKIQKTEDEKFSRLPMFHKLNLEKEASDCFRIFVCEGQPKNKTSWGGRTIYHDGTRFAISLVEHGFSNIFIIPDAVASSLVVPFYQDAKFPSIDYVIVGANGYDDEMFLHSAGHTMVAALTSFVKSVCDEDVNKVLTKSFKDRGRHPTLILAIITDKYKYKFEPPPKKKETSKKKEKSKDNDTISVDGWRFQDSFSNEPIRTQVFISQDQELRSTLNKDAPTVRFYNPREDRIPICCVDAVFTEKAWLDKKKEKEMRRGFDGKSISEATSDSSASVEKNNHRKEPNNSQKSKEKKGTGSDKEK